MSGTRRWRESERGNAAISANLDRIRRPDGSIPFAETIPLVPGQDISEFRGIGWMTGPVVVRIRCDLCGVEWAHVWRLDDGRHLLQVRPGLALLGETTDHHHRFVHCGATQLVSDRRLLAAALAGTGDSPSRLRIPRGSGSALLD